MNFIEAMKLLNEGKDVRRAIWEDSSLHLFRDGDILLACWGRNGKYSQGYDMQGHFIGEESSIINVFLAEDWEIYEEPTLKYEEPRLKPKLHTFEEAYAALRDNKAIIRNHSLARVCQKGNGSFNTWDIEAKDWIILGEEV